jgi:6-phosphogluconolactonase
LLLPPLAKVNGNASGRRTHGGIPEVHFRVQKYQSQSQKKKMKTKVTVISAILTVAATLTASAEPGTEANGAVFTMNNSSNENQVLVFHRGENGALTFASEVSTGGLGTGAGLGSQGGVVLSEGHQWLFAVNAGSHEISVFKVLPEGIILVDKVDSGGLNPISLTSSGNLLYVLNSGGNAGGVDNITGFTVNSRGQLRQIPGAQSGLSAATTSPAQVGFSPDGKVLVVTEKNTSLIDTFTVKSDEGTLVQHKIFQSPGTEPFGFAFDQRGRLFVTEAPGSAVSSYSVSNDGELTLISQSVPDNQQAACWFAVTKNGQFGYAANAAANTTSGYRIGRDGSVSLLNADGVSGVTGAGPNDLTFSEDSRNLYILDAKDGSISVFRVGSNGALQPGTPATVPVGSDGVAAY